MEADAELAMAIALSLQEERQRRTAQETTWQVLHELQCCGTSYFSLALLATCPSCGRPELRTEPSHTAPVDTIPSPGEGPAREGSAPLPKATMQVHQVNVCRAKARSLAIKPTVGSFHRYNSRMLLHVGLTDTSGRVYNFDEGGLHIDDDWNECISIPLEAAHLSDSDWNAELDRHHKAEFTFKSYRPYRQLANNCYDYVIRFLNGVRFEERDNHQKEDIVRRLIQTPVDLFESYFAVLNKLNTREARQRGYIKLDGAAAPRHTCDACGKPIAAHDTRYRCAECENFDLCSACKDKESSNHKRSHPMLAVEGSARYTCDSCRNSITTTHYRCRECPDFDLCGGCHDKEQLHHSSSHPKQHRLVKM